MNIRVSSVVFFLVLFASCLELAAQELYVEPLKKAPIAKTSFSILKMAPHGDVLALAGAEKLIRFIDPVSLKEKVTLTARSPHIMELAFSRDGRYLVSAGADGLLSEWNAPDGLLLKEVQAHGKGLGVRAVDISATGRIVSGGGDGEIKLWNMNSEDIFGMFPKVDEDGEVMSVAFDPVEGRVAAAYANGAIKIFDPQTYLVLRTLTELKSKATNLVYSPNGKYLAASGADSTVRIWEGQTGFPLQTIRGFTAPVTSLAFNPNNTWLVSASGVLRISDVLTGASRKVIADTSEVFTAALFLPDSSTLVACSASGDVATFMVLTQKPDKEPPTIVIQKPIPKEGDVFKIYAPEIEVAGFASDESGVKDVKVGGQAAKLSEPANEEKTGAVAKNPSKNFVAVAQLPTVGVNEISVSSTDERGNTGTKSVRVQRLAKEAAVEILSPADNAETDQASANLEFKVWFEYTRYSITLNTVEITSRENLPRKPIGAAQSETFPLSSGFNQIQFVVYGKNGEKISKIINMTRRVLTSAASVQMDKPQRSPSGQPQQWAVVIGISEYSNPTIKNLSYADRDARDFAEFLKSSAGGGFEPDRMKILLNKDATMQNVKQALFNFLRGTVEKDLVVIYFAGHGAPEPANPANNYLLTYDTDPLSLETTAFPMWDINTALMRYIPSRHVVVFTDACHSGGISSDLATRGVSLSESNLINQYLSDLSKSKEGTIVFTASQAGEVSQELDKFGHGVFTYYLLQGMKGAADVNNDYTVTIGELMDYVEEAVKRQTKGNQHPTRNQGNYDKELTISLIPH